MMDEKEINHTAEQARTIAALLPALLRQLFTLDDGVAGELPLAQLRVCGMLHDGPLAMSSLSRELGVSLSAMTQIANRLERAGLVKRVTAGNDRRIRCLRLTPHGQQIMQQRQQARTGQILAVLEQLSPSQRCEVLATFQMLMQACTAIKDQAELAGQIRQ
jgi:DNA-binding MarR family transcriptional regulator